MLCTIGLRRHLKYKHLWLHEKYLQRYGRVENESADLDESGVSSGENNEFGSENMSFSDFDHEKLLANFLLELREI